jgi:hypothetical protein
MLMKERERESILYSKVVYYRQTIIKHNPSVSAAAWPRLIVIQGPSLLISKCRSGSRGLSSIGDDSDACADEPSQ